MSLDLFPAPPVVWDMEREWEWLRGEPFAVGDEARPALERIYAARGDHDAFEAAKCLRSLSGRHRIEGWDVSDAEALGLYDPCIDYHVCWDRCWAARRGLPKEDALGVMEWNYAKDEPSKEDTE